MIQIMSDPVIRPYRPSDRDAIYDVCLRTADAGQDATALYRNPELVGDLFAGPYAYLEPDFAFVLDDGGRAVGYVLGAPDTARFAKAMRDRWLPLVGAKYPLPAGPPANRDEQMTELLHNPEWIVHPELADYPAHLHIDLLPAYQRSGHGRRLIHTLLTALHEAGSPRVHLGMLTANTTAGAFYRRIGFHEIPVTDPGPITYLGRATEI
jgi:ribosomal protein S18 acetylase RimI-like enzyme